MQRLENWKYQDTAYETEMNRIVQWLKLPKKNANKDKEVRQDKNEKATKKT